jgi:hypothetical protein
VAAVSTTVMWLVILLAIQLTGRGRSKREKKTRQGAWRFRALDCRRHGDAILIVTNSVVFQSDRCMMRNESGELGTLSTLSIGIGGMVGGGTVEFINRGLGKAS